MIGPLSYIGGKRRLANHLLTLIPEHITYVEPFAGGAQLFFHKPRSRVEVLNDRDDEIVNFLRVCQRHPTELTRVLRWQPASRRLFDWYRAQVGETLTDIERAARFFYLQKNTWGGKRTRRNFHFSVTKPPSYRPPTLPERLAEVADRLEGAQIESLDYAKLVDQYDRPTTFFYCDPPYVGVDLYAHNFTDQQFKELAQRLNRIAGRVLLSINDCPKARRWFKDFECQEVTLTYSSSRQPRMFPELLFANYPLPQVVRRLDTAPVTEGVTHTETLNVLASGHDHVV
jgi:DNA adenine methylase